MAKLLWLPDAGQVAEIHQELTKIFEQEDDPISPPGIKEPGYLDSACHRPFTGAGGQDKYVTPWQKFAALFHSLTKAHAFHNGNKRTAIVTLLTMLHRNDYRFTSVINDDAIYDLALRVTADTFPSDDAPAKGDHLITILADWLCENTESTTLSIPTMRVTEFLKRCEEAGCSVKKSGRGGKWVVQNHGKGSLSFSQSTPEISGNVVKTYLRRLALTASGSGILSREFQEGLSNERAEMHRYMAALRRLAKT